MEEIKNLLEQCLNCKNPTCITGCPAGNNIVGFINLVKEKKIDEAYELISKTSTLPSICSLVCPFEKQCMGSCIKNKIGKPVNIPMIENYIANHANKKTPIIIKNNKSISIVGSGPSGLACAELLALKGYDITIYDKYDNPGGILLYGIPDFVLNKKIVKEKIDYIKSLGVKFVMNTTLQKDIFIEDLIDKYDAIYLAIGASVSKKMEAKNNEIKGVIDANDFLEKMYRKDFAQFKNIKNCLVIGGGNTAIDAARSAKRLLDCNVSIVYRRSENEMPANKKDINLAKIDGVEFNFLSNPIEYIGNETVTEVECIKMKLEKVDNDRPRPIIIENSNYKIKAELVIEAISSQVDTNISKYFKTTKWKTIEVDEKMQTSISKVFAGGDVVSGPSLVVSAMKDGMKAAISIDDFLNK